MAVPEFAIPYNLDDLSQIGGAGQFCVSDNLTIGEMQERIDEARRIANENVGEFAVDHFSTFFSYLKKFKQIPDPLRQKGLTVIRKAFSRMSIWLNGLLQEESLEKEVQHDACNIVKMVVYLLVEITNHFQSRATEPSITDGGKTGRKKQKAVSDDGFDWVEERHSILIDIANFLQLKIKMLWDPPIVEEEFVNLFANACYRILEDPNITGMNLKPHRSTIFQIFHILISEHLHGLSFCVKVVQMLRMNEHLVNPLVQGVVELVKAGCNSIVREIVREVGEADEQLLSDNTGARCISQFLASVAEAVPEAVVPATTMLIDLLEGDSSNLRCCVISVLGEIVLATLTKEDLDPELKQIRDTHLDTLEDHIHDVNAFVRARVLQVWQKLCTAKAIPIARTSSLLELVLMRLNDKSTLVRKQAVQLIKLFLECNPYSGQLNANEISSLLAEEQGKLNALKKKHYLEDINREDEWKLIEPKLRKIIEAISDKESPPIEEGLTLEKALQRIGDYLGKGELSAAVGVLGSLRSDFYEQLGCEDGDDEEFSLQVLRKIWELREVPQEPKEVPEVSDDVLDRKANHEKAIEYLEGALEFTKLIDRALPLIRTFLDSSAIPEVLEAINFFTAAYQFGFPAALDGVQRMLELVFSQEEAAKTAVCNAYKQLYFETDTTGRKQSILAVKRLSELVLKLNICQMSALEEVVRNWVQTDVIDKGFIQVLFERFSMKISGTTDGESWAALALISMVGAEQPKIVRSNVSVLVSEGLGPRGFRKLILAEFTCRALQKIPLDHTPEEEILPSLRRLLRDAVWSTDPNYVRFADEAVQLLFMMANRPDTFIEELIIDLFGKLSKGRSPVIRQPKGRALYKKESDEGDLFDDEAEKENKDEEVIEEEQEVSPESSDDMKPENVLIRMTRFLSLLGTIAAHYVSFLEGKVLGELKRRNAVEFERKIRRYADKSMEIEKEDLDFQRMAADDMHAMEMKKLTEDEVVKGSGLLAKFLPFILKICKQPGKFPYLPLQNAALLALGMFMQISSSVCDEHLQLLLTITQKSQNTEKRQNGLLLLWALQFRFPNLLEPWTAHMFSLLRDSEASVRRVAVVVLTNLIVNEMVKARNHLGALAVCVIDPNPTIAQTTRHFFREYANKGAALFNVLPSLPSYLTQSPNCLEEEEFQKVMRFLMDLVNKDKQVDLLVEKFCQYFECTSDDRQCRDLAFCLSLLQFSEKSIKKALENFRCFGSKLYIAEVYETFSNALTTAARNPHKDKTALEELTSLIDEYRNKTCEDRNVPVTLKKKCPPSTRKRAPRRKLLSSESENENDEFEERPPTRSKSVRQQKIKSPPDSDGEGDAFVKTKTVPTSTRKRPGKKKPLSSDSEAESAPKITRSTRKTGTVRKKIILEDDSDNEEKLPPRSTRKRR